jgi:hypothetical protein
MSIDITTFVDPTDPDFAEIRGMAIAGFSLDEMRAMWRLKHSKRKVVSQNGADPKTFSLDQTTQERNSREND